MPPLNQYAPLLHQELPFAVLQNLLDNDQTGFLKGRSIAENICLINNVISYTELKNIPGLLLFADTIESTFVEKTLLVLALC